MFNIFKNKNIYHKRFKGNALNEIDEVKKGDGTPFKVFTPFWRTAEKLFSEKIPSKEEKIKKCINKTNYFKNCINAEKILPKKDWLKILKKFGIQMNKRFKRITKFY